MNSRPIPRDTAAIVRAAVLLGFFEGLAGACTSACLLGVAVNELFSILFCVLLGIFAIVFAIIAWKADKDRLMRCYAISGAILMPLAGVAAIFVDNDFVADQHWAVKCPLFMLLAAGLFINFAINIIQIINCSTCFNFKDRLLTNRTQVTVLLALNIALGFILGLVFGLLDPEENGAPQRKMTIAVIVFLFVGLAAGVAFGVYVETQTQKENAGALVTPLTSVDSAAHDAM
jgi:hypothetical protein